MTGLVEAGSWRLGVHWRNGGVGPGLSDLLLKCFRTADSCLPSSSDAPAVFELRDGCAAALKTASPPAAASPTRGFGERSCGHRWEVTKAIAASQLSPPKMDTFAARWGVTHEDVCRIHDHTVAVPAAPTKLFAVRRGRSPGCTHWCRERWGRIRPLPGVCQPDRTEPPSAPWTPVVQPPQCCAPQPSVHGGLLSAVASWIPWASV